MIHLLELFIIAHEGDFLPVIFIYFISRKCSFFAFAVFDISQGPIISDRISWCHITASAMSFQPR